ncbi:TonB-dependent receptor [Sphingorhabdus sp.]|uniref:TonB-dependent receptor n=1 Tax=Sphingorhabdus sp. TaxID=1902408 RepID=UPI003BAE2D29|nr:TonB-dependent receptor plug domain-containing protein [Sphingomonadales bacterium]MBL0022591.1 TonB-dependent receptor plug domain-containing protein [Sphingomonadales bacterium]
MKKAMMACLAATVFATPIHAEEAESDGKEIIVTGVLANDDTPINPVRLPQSARVSSQTLDAEDVDKRQARDVFDLLNYGTGVFTTTSGKKAPANLNIRGDGNFAFIIDGAYVPPQLASRILQTIPAAAVEEVRIVRTSTALTINPLVGIVTPSGAPNNGFIVVRTRKPKETMMLLGIQGGSFNTIGGNAQLGTRFKLGNADGYVHAIGGAYTTDGPKDFNLDKHHQTLGLKGGIDAGVVALDLSLLKSWAGYGIVRGNAKLRPNTQDDEWRFDRMDSLIATANGTVRWNEQNTTLLTLAYTESKGDFVTSDRLANGNLANTIVRDNDNSFVNAAVRHNLFLGDTKLQAGADYIHWKNPSGQYYYEGIPREEKVTGFFLQGDQALFDGRLNLDLGARLDRVVIVKGIDYFLAGRGPNANVRQIRNEKLPRAKFYSAGASFKLTSDWLINARYGYSSQGPRQGVVLANPAIALKGESRQKWEVGFDGRLADWLRPSVNAFFIKTNNEVQPISYAVVAGEQVGLYANTDSKRTGAEAIVQGRWGADGSEGGYRASVTHYFNVLDPTGLLARTQPRTVAELTLDQSFGAWRVAGAAKYVSRYESNAFTRCAAPNLNCVAPAITSPYLPLGDFTNVDFNISRNFEMAGSAMRITAAVKNLLDDNYETSIGYPSIGRQFSLELTAAF